MARVIFERHPELAGAERDPRGLTAPSRLYELALERQRRDKRRTGQRRQLAFQARRERKRSANGDAQGFHPANMAQATLLGDAASNPVCAPSSKPSSRTCAT